ncbi:Hypothetical protein DEACI_4037 [Acididesulfobacillus acetoxydans]|uniref:Uncharacterized protein n=1 Tax=Acididesulfobacillus acetoxydans TaxID=1561005 RepID=A0A8S0WRC4_9FIRM|nr:hypothetical protein [Acididesulfobacillus acetoxydans]CAA7603214.1 Hypothetical protein DEACI_4037 [Acididesulfobacillus acetoxydans]
MERTEILRRQREEIISRLNAEDGERTKLLVALMDIDDEMEEMGQRTSQVQLPPMPSRRRIKREWLA